MRFIAIFILLSAIAPHSQACVRADLWQGKNRWQDASQIFIGKVQSRKISRSGHGFTLEIYVTENLKGKASGIRTVEDHAPFALCGESYDNPDVGEDALVFYRCPKPNECTFFAYKEKEVQELSEYFRTQARDKNEKVH